MSNIRPYANTPAGRDSSIVEADVQQVVRLRDEATRIAASRESAKAGRVITFEDVSVWVDSLDTPHALPRPRVAR